MSEGYGLPFPERAERLKVAAAECLKRAVALLESGCIEEAASYASAAGSNLNYFVGYTYRVPTLESRPALTPPQAQE